MHRSRHNRKFIQDLELRLGPSFPPKGGNMLTSNFVRGFPDLITIDDDDEDVQVFSPRSSSETLRFFPRVSSWVPVISDEDLELRLGLKAHNAIEVPDEHTSEDPFTWACVKKKKLGQASTSRCGVEVQEVKFRCSICMDTMKEETSTMCGHVFCKPCITSAIRVQKKCPTCREKLTLNNIHRIYLPGATS
ncbi:hypothetical protein H6P81_013412 [Aristolochia fimbriata]|uniref:RING-type domain-containing protein n=1 Tax=Aristolochia fimbriata TaxID=158543 RepID=A0AAV7EF48_ARIFI|nr:hypothetical protein H6P81_013412 [Aristolochia fimbriata]